MRTKTTWCPQRTVPVMLAGILPFTISIAQDGTEDNEIFELSPFSVEASDNEGYRAQNTLAGTRLKSNLGDIASSISVFTEEFLDDIGATNIQDAYLYSVNTENENEYSSNDTEGHGVSSTNSSRVRGLVASTTTRGFFDTRFRADTYNSERFTLARGPNSILYGIGSPAGLMNATLKKARTNEDSYEVEYRFDSEDGNRVMVDFNKVLIEDKLAIRFAAVEQEIETWKDPEIDDEARRYGALTFRPTENTTISANYEHMKNTRSKARGRLAKEEIKQWEAAGRPFIDSFNDRVTYDNGATWVDELVIPSGYGLAREGQTIAVSALQEPEQHALGFNRDSGSKFRSGESRTYMHGHLDLDPSAFSVIEDPETRAIYEGLGYQGLIFLDSAITVGDPDPNVPFRTFTPEDTLVPTNFNIHGLTSATDFKGENYGASIEHRFTDDLYVELAVNHEEWSRYFVDPIRGENAIVYVDINYYIPLWRLNRTVGGPDNPSYNWASRPNRNQDKLRDGDGEFVLIENPNVGRYYTEGQLIGFHETIDQDNLRFTASYEMDFTEQNKHLGRHALAVLYQKDEIEQFQRKLRAFNAFDYKLSNGNNLSDIGDGQNNLLNRYYIDFPGMPLTGGENSIRYPGRYELQDPDFWPQVIGGFSGDGRPILNRREIEGKMAVLQSRFMDNRLITTFGVRNDEETQFGTRDPATIRDERGEYQPDPIPDDPYYSDDGTTRTKGVVFKATDWLSLFYNESDSYLPQGQYQSVLGGSLPPANGEGEDYGFMLNLLEGKLFTRVSWYEQTAFGALEFDWIYNRTRFTVIRNSNRWIEDFWEELTPENFGGVADPALDDRKQWAADLGLSFENDYSPEGIEFTDFTRMTRDYESEGMEVELHAKPLENWDVVLTFGKNESKNLNSLPYTLQAIDQRIDVWEKYYNLPKNPTDADFYGPSVEIDGVMVDGFANVSNDTVDWNPSYLADPSDQWAINRTDSIGNNNLVHPNGLALVALAREEVGTANTRSRKYRTNLITNYRFNDGKFKGLGIGGAVRWRSESAIGYMGKTNPINPASFTLVPDITRPIWGEELWDFDAWVKYRHSFTVADREIDWRIQLNVKNLFDDNDIYPVVAHTDGSILQWEQKAPRTWMITNSFEF
ncbi:TonB-dependent receptor plug domain-containing protein [Pelagicoccus mobilis]|uniref:TonB-dependent receptor plug domain-containing protein n=1 Tax=Pelagicoccus mobilis TaxID=415221 RepID=A0A934RXU1_9BACT|nr:TonB-dependent receptor plug domain-containing protein [Pelagicoccus mobilis]MBK1879715.1 hypothetical protein [Pelagicoccus mobilis]